MTEIKAARTGLEDVEEALKDVIEEQVGKALDGVVDEWRLNWVWMPPWGPERITEDGRDQMRALGYNI
jgi:metal-sulfur cluster biosynthetic enzyme